MTIEALVLAAKSVKDTVSTLLTIEAKIKDADAKKALLALDGQLIDLETKLLAVRKEHIEAEKKLFDAQQEILKLKREVERLQTAPTDDGYVLRKDGTWEKDGRLFCAACFENEKRRVAYEKSDIFLKCPRCKHERTIF